MCFLEDEEELGCDKVIVGLVQESGFSFAIADIAVLVGHDLLVFDSFKLSSRMKRGERLGTLFLTGCHSLQAW